MEVPNVAMKEILRLHKVKPDGTSTEDYADALLGSELTSPIAPTLADEFRFAGKTVVNLCVPIDGFDNSLKNKESFRRRVESRYGSTLFNQRNRVTLSLDPVPIRVYELDSKFIIEYSYYGNEQRVLDNYEIRKRRPQLINYVIIHFNPFLIEVRSSAEDREKFLMALTETIGLDPTKMEWNYDSVLSEAEIRMLSTALHAKLRVAKHKMPTGIYATVEVSATPQVPDLSQEDQYQNQFRGARTEKKTYQFNYHHSFGFTQSVTLTITRKGGLWFRTSIGEEVINHVINTLISIRQQIATVAATAST